MLIKIKPNCCWTINFLLLAILIFAGCDEKTSMHSLGETELYFDEKTTSVSSGEDHTIWVGSETGRLWRVSGNHPEAFDVGTDRIYKVLESRTADGHSILWIGIRNSGLQKWELKGNSLVKLKTYTIPAKGDRYSTYDICQSGDSLFLATTQGMYLLDQNNPNDTLSLLYPSVGELTDTYNYSFVTYNICTNHLNKLWAATEHGLLTYDLTNKLTHTELPDQAFNHVSVSKDTLYAVSGNKLYLSEISGEIIRSINLPFSPKVYYQSGGVHYLTDRDNMAISKNLKDFRVVPLRKKMADQCRNVILPDFQKDFSILLMEDAIWRVPKHTGVFSGNDIIKIACNSGEVSYFLTSGNDLYFQNKGESVANPIYTFPLEEQISWMSTDGDKLYYCNSKNEIKELAVSRFLLKNTFFHKPRLIYKSKHKITAAYLKNQGNQTQLFFGIQDGLWVINPETDEVDSVAGFEHRYVTSFFTAPHSKSLYLSTLNSGVYYANRDTAFKYIDHTSEHASIKDLIVTGDYPPQLITLTNHDILSHVTNDSLETRGYHKLIYLNDTLFYAIGDTGIRKIISDQAGYLHDGGLFYTDIRFNPAAAYVKDQTLFLGSNMGVLRLTPHQEDEARWITFTPGLNVGVKYILLFAALSALFVIYAVFRHYRRKRMNRVQLNNQLNELKACADELMLYYNLSNDHEKAEIDQLRAEIERIDITKQRKKELNQLISSLTSKIILHNREISLRLLKKLETQIAQISNIHAYEQDLLLEESMMILKSDDIDLIRKQVSINESWIQEYNTFRTDRDAIQQQMNGAISIHGLTSCIFELLNKINEDSGHVPLSELQKGLAELKIMLRKIDSPEFTELTESYIQKQTRYLNEREEQNEISELLINELVQIRASLRLSNPYDILRSLNEIHERIEFLRVKDDIGVCIDKYIQGRDQVIHDNDQLINKKFDKDLDLIITEKTKLYADRIEHLIVTMYKILHKTDQSVLNDLLKITSYYHQQAKVLALLLVNPRIKRFLIPGMLGVYGNLNPVISRLINSKIKSNEEVLRHYYEEKPLHKVFVYYILKLID